LGAGGAVAVVLAQPMPASETTAAEIAVLVERYLA
jgi:hypothetical protein